MLDANDRADHELLRNGEIARLLAKYEPAVTGRCAARVRNADAEDVAQNVMLRIYGEYKRGKRWNGVPFRVVLHQVTGWTIKDYFEGRRYTDPLPEDWNPGSENSADEVVGREWVMDLLTSLTERERRICELWIFEGFGDAPDQATTTRARNRSWDRLGPGCLGRRSPLWCVVSDRRFGALAEDAILAPAPDGSWLLFLAVPLSSR
jgi:DNA-directed RNA polymerase specialized sigma24 family protein